MAYLLCTRLERERTDDMRAQLERMTGLMEKVRKKPEHSIDCLYIRHNQLTIEASAL